MTLRTGEDILIWRRRFWIALYGGIVLEEALGPVVRQNTEWINEYAGTCMFIQIWWVIDHASLKIRREKIQLHATQWFIELIIRSTCFGYYYVHHQEFETIQVITACGTWHFVESWSCGLECGCRHSLQRHSCTESETYAHVVLRDGGLVFRAPLYNRQHIAFNLLNISNFIIKT